MYEWSVCYAHEKMDGDIGETSIASCLSSGVANLPDSEHLVEVKYRGLHMGTFSKTSLVEDAAAVADRIADAYGAHIEMVQ